MNQPRHAYTGIRPFTFYAVCGFFLAGLMSCPAYTEDTALETALKGIAPGMEIADFWDRHPNARAGSADRYLGSDAVAAQHQTLYLDEEADAWLELPLMGSFGFVDRRLKEWVINWNDPEGDSTALRRFFEGCIAVHGPDFQREAIRLHTAGSEEDAQDILLPVLMWREGDQVVLAYHQRRTPQNDAEAAPEDNYIYALLPGNDPFVKEVLVGRQLSGEHRDALFVPFPWLPPGQTPESLDNPAEAGNE